MLTIKEDDADRLVNEMRVMAERLMDLGCDSVQIIGTAMAPGGKNTFHLRHSVGNVYARIAACEHWVETTKAEGEQ